MHHRSPRRASRFSSSAPSPRPLVLSALLASTLGACADGHGDAGASRATSLDLGDPTSPGASPSARRIVDALRDVRVGAVSGADAPTAPAERAMSPRLLGDPQVTGFDREGSRLRAVVAHDVLRGVSRPAGLAVPVRASDPFEVEDHASGLTMRVALEGAVDVEAEIEGGYVVYRGAVRGADVVHRATATGTEDYVAFAHAPAVPEVTYAVAPGDGVAGLRLAANTLELLDASGAPRLRVAPPFVVGADGARHAAAIAVDGCAVDTSPAPPWGRAVTPPGAETCTIRVGWHGAEVAYPAVLDPSWVTTGDMAAARTLGHAAVPLTDGRILVAGGTGNVRTVELFDPASGTWSVTGELLFSRFGPAMVMLPSGRVLVSGGQGSAGFYVPPAEVWDPTGGTWTAAAPMLYPRLGHTMTVLGDGRVLAAGGLETVGAPLSRSELFDPDANTWTATGAALAPRAHHTAVRLASGRVLVAAGHAYDGNLVAPVATAELYDPATGTWSPTGAVATPRWSHLGVELLDGRVLLAGGLDATSFVTASAELYDPLTGTWSATGSMATPRQVQAGATLGNGTVIVAGGWTNGNVTLASTEAYDPATGAWSPRPAMPQQRSHAVAVALGDDRMLVIGGHGATEDASVVYDTLEATGTACTDAASCRSGFCVDGVCCDTACGGGATDDCQACGVAAGAAEDGVCGAVAEAAAVVCRADADACDVAETCVGVSTSCPDDAVAPDGTPCAFDGVCEAGVCVAPSGEGGSGGQAAGGAGEGGLGTGGSGGTGEGGIGGTAPGVGGAGGAGAGVGSTTATSAATGAGSSTASGSGGAGGAADDGEGTGDGGGCDCGVTGRRAPGLPSLALATVLALALRRRRPAA